MDHATASTVMIVGDDSDFNYLMQRYVRQSGYQMAIAHPGEKVLKLAKRKRPTVIILEIDPPKTVGWDMLQALKADPDTHDIPVVICSWADERTRGLAEGATAYLRKPVLYGDFLKALADAGQVIP
jgi:CheY-like chemotaxis protein